MEYIKEHLKQNFTVDENDFNELPVLLTEEDVRNSKKSFLKISGNYCHKLMKR